VLTVDNALWCLWVLMALGGAFGVISHLGRDTYWDGDAR
jgi:hypothetical protein